MADAIARLHLQERHRLVDGAHATHEVVEILARVTGQAQRRGVPAIAGPRPAPGGDLLPGPSHRGTQEADGRRKHLVRRIRLLAGDVQPHEQVPHLRVAPGLEQRMGLRPDFRAQRSVPGRTRTGLRRQRPVLLSNEVEDHPELGYGGVLLHGGVPRAPGSEHVSGSLRLLALPRGLLEPEHLVPRAPRGREPRLQPANSARAMGLHQALLVVGLAQVARRGAGVVVHEAREPAVTIDGMLERGQRQILSQQIGVDHGPIQIGHTALVLQPEVQAIK